MSDSSKITAEHLRRAAFVYVRQSTTAQVESNRESTDRQYRLVERAGQLGWKGEQVHVVDEDLGISGSGLAERSGFAHLIAQVALGHVGIVLGLEVSRLARNNADWYRLLDLCGATDTLIGDADGIYHPALFNDRLVLGLKGTMSEAELHVLRARLEGGIRNKAARGELRLRRLAHIHERLPAQVRRAQLRPLTHRPPPRPRPLLRSAPRAAPSPPGAAPRPAAPTAPPPAPGSLPDRGATARSVLSALRCSGSSSPARTTRRSTPSSTRRACSRSSSEASVPACAGLASGSRSVHAAGISARLPSGSTSSRSSRPRRRIHPISPSEQPSNG